MAELEALLFDVDGTWLILSGMDIGLLSMRPLMR